MEYQIIQINHNSWRIEDSGVRFFVLTGQDLALLIDSGRNVHTARDIAATLTNLPIMLLNTHADGDHVGSNAQFESLYMHPDEEPNYEICLLLVINAQRTVRGSCVVPLLHPEFHRHRQQWFSKWRIYHSACNMVIYDYIMMASDR